MVWMSDLVHSFHPPLPNFHAGQRPHLPFITYGCPFTTRLPQSLDSQSHPKSACCCLFCNRIHDHGHTRETQRLTLTKVAKHPCLFFNLYNKILDYKMCYSICILRVIEHDTCDWPEKHEGGNSKFMIRMRDFRCGWTQLRRAHQSLTQC